MVPAAPRSPASPVSGVCPCWTEVEIGGTVGPRCDRLADAGPYTMLCTDLGCGEGYWAGFRLDPSAAMCGAWGAIEITLPVSTDELEICIARIEERCEELGLPL